jgi:hypothetical protein
MKTKVLLNFLALSCFAAAPILVAQDTDKKTDKSADVRNITGCLTKGDSANEFDITGEDGSTWEVKSKTVKLTPHVGHTVTVTGEVWHPDMHGAKEKAKETVESNPKEHGHLNVTKLSMVSESCKK